MEIRPPIVTGSNTNIPDLGTRISAKASGSCGRRDKHRVAIAIQKLDKCFGGLSGTRILASSWNTGPYQGDLFVKSRGWSGQQSIQRDRKNPLSALLNASRYRKEKAEKAEEESAEDDGEDDELCPVECVREFQDSNELDGILEESKRTKTLVVVDFYRTACGSCRYIEKGFVKLCKGAGNCKASVVFLKHNVMDEYEEQSDVAAKYKIRVVPLFHFYKDGELVESFPTREKGKILEAIYKYLGQTDTIEDWSDINGHK